MLQLTLKNLGAHKRRLFSTSLAVILGVAFLSATLMLGDTMRAGFKVDIVEGVGDTAVTVRGSKSSTQSVPRLWPSCVVSGTPT